MMKRKKEFHTSKSNLKALLTQNIGSFSGLKATASGSFKKIDVETNSPPDSHDSPKNDKIPVNAWKDAVKAIDYFYKQHSNFDGNFISVREFNEWFFDLLSSYIQKGSC